MTQETTPTLGQVAYEAYWPAFGMAPQLPWEQVIADSKRAWEAAAQAVLAAQESKP